MLLGAVGLGGQVVSTQAGAGTDEVAEHPASRPPSEADRRHRLRFFFTSPPPRDLAGFSTRFGSTEASIPLVKLPGTPTRPGTCRLARPGFEVRLVDEEDAEVPTGSVGELVVRHRQPWVLSKGCLDDPEATVRAWRNGWFHTGDPATWDRETAGLSVTRHGLVATGRGTGLRGPRRAPGHPVGHTGNVGRVLLEAVLDHPGLELGRRPLPGGLGPPARRRARR